MEVVSLIKIKAISKEIKTWYLPMATGKIKDIILNKSRILYLHQDFNIQLLMQL